MKKGLKSLLGTLTFITVVLIGTVLVFGMISCDNGGGGGNNESELTVAPKFQGFWTTNNVYYFQITENSFQVFYSLEPLNNFGDPYPAWSEGDTLKVKQDPAIEFTRELTLSEDGTELSGWSFWTYPSYDATLTKYTD